MNKTAVDFSRLTDDEISGLINSMCISLVGPEKAWDTFNDKERFNILLTKAFDEFLLSDRTLITKQHDIAVKLSGLSDHHIILVDQPDGFELISEHIFGNDTKTRLGLLTDLGPSGQIKYIDKNSNISLSYLRFIKAIIPDTHRLIQQYFKYLPLVRAGREI